MEITFATFFRREALEDVQMAQNRHSSVVSWHHGISDSLTIFYYFKKKKNTERQGEIEFTLFLFWNGGKQFRDLRKFHIFFSYSHSTSVYCIESLRKLGYNTTQLILFILNHSKLHYITRVILRFVQC